MEDQYNSFSSSSPPSAAPTQRDPSSPSPPPSLSRSSSTIPPSSSSSSSASPSLSRSSSTIPPSPASLSVLSSFLLNGSREMNNHYSANFSDLLVKPQFENSKHGDGEVPDHSPATESSPYTMDETPNTPTKRKTPDDPLGIGEDKELSSDDKKVIKKQRRLAKNREAAQLFRQRQKEYISNLETRANQLIAANTEANARAELIASENKLMREQLAYLRNFMKQAVSFSFPYNNNGPAPTSPAGLVPTNPFLAGMMPPHGMNMGVDSMGNFIDSTNAHSGNMGLPSSVPLADGTSISFNLMPSTGSSPPSYLSFMPVGPNPLGFANGAGPTSTNGFSSSLVHEGGNVKGEKELGPD